MLNNLVPRLFRPSDRAALGWGLWAAGALLVQHVLLWPAAGYVGGMRRPVPYALGTATLAVAFGRWAAAYPTAHAGAAYRAYLVIVACGGAATIGAYGVRAVLSAPARAATELDEAVIGDAPYNPRLGT